MAEKESKKFAIASLVSGILSWIGIIIGITFLLNFILLPFILIGIYIPLASIICSLLAIIFFIISIKKQEPGKEMAIVGLTLGIIALLIWVLILISFLVFKPTDVGVLV